MNIKIKLTDNSPGKVFTRIFSNKENAEVALRASASPSPELIRIMGHEMVNSIKGSYKRNISLDSSSGVTKVVLTRQKGTYQNGIMKKSSPDGHAFRPLTDTTMMIRAEHKHNLRGRSFILRETSMHILKGLGILRFSRNYKQSAGVTVGWANPENREIARKQNEGFMTVNPAVQYAKAEWLKPPPDVSVPARPFIGYSKELVENLRNIMLAWIGGKNA